jgi:hypothetical protein
MVLKILFSQKGRNFFIQRLKFLAILAGKCCKELATLQLLYIKRKNKSGRRPFYAVLGIGLVSHDPLVNQSWA